ncbi:MAG: hypothetical protein AUJ82_04420 [Verrucomicrobia bacterium CG1_02_43_26]|nr:MAG: hypothetical protein AUJ82_04420 [Verrucomicrobia bacterium CG1_02_43_26]
MYHLTDLDELAGRIRSSFSKEYMCEAITAYRAGAYRAALTTTWVAVCIDIMEKIKELSDSGDERAQKLAKELDQIKITDKMSMQKFENELLTDACDKLEIITPLERTYLERLKDDRNICVHPTFQNEGEHFKVTPENVRAHMVAACKYLLILEPVQGKMLIEKILNDIEKLPDDEESAIELLKSNHRLGRAKDSVFRNLCIVILKTLFKSDLELENTKLKRILIVLKAIEGKKPDILRVTIKEKLCLLLMDAERFWFKHVFAFFNLYPKSYEGLEGSVKILICDRIKKLSAEEMIRCFEGVEYSDSGVPEIKDALSARVKSFEYKERIEVLSIVVWVGFKSLVIELMKESTSWESIRSNGNKCLFPYIELLDAEDVRAVIVGFDDHVYSTGNIDMLLVKLYQRSKELSVEDHNALWCNFAENVSKEKSSRGSPWYEFYHLKKVLIEDDIIAEESEPPQEVI